MELRESAIHHCLQLLRYGIAVPLVRLLTAWRTLRREAYRQLGVIGTGGARHGVRRREEFQIVRRCVALCEKGIDERPVGEGEP